MVPFDSDTIEDTFKSFLLVIDISPFALAFTLFTSTLMFLLVVESRSILPFLAISSNESAFISTFVLLLPMLLFDVATYAVFTALIIKLLISEYG